METFSASILSSTPDSLTISLSGRVSSDNDYKVEQTLAALRAESPEGKLCIDAKGLVYISSSGLRLMTRLLKREGFLRLVNASHSIYDMFEMTGMTEIMEVRRTMREVSVEGCELLGSGAKGDVYRLAKDTMVKVFRPTVPLDEIEKERRVSRKVFVLGVPCALPFDTVRCGDCYGTVYEALDAKTITECIRENPETLHHYAVESAKLLRELHAIKVPAGALPPAARAYHEVFDGLTDNFSADEIAELHDLLRTLPAKRRFIHGDYHTKNIMDSHGELMLIDLGAAGPGNPLLDVIRMYFTTKLMGAGFRERAQDEMSFIGLTFGELGEYWDAFLPVYCGNDARAARLDDLLEPWGWMLYLSASIVHLPLPQKFHALYAEWMRSKVLARADEMRAHAEELSSLCV